MDASDETIMFQPDGLLASVLAAVSPDQAAPFNPLAPPPQAYRKDFADVELTFRPADLRRPSG